MSQSFSQLPRQILSQQQRLTPQLIQAMDILQLNAMALESRIEQELDGNPALEAISADDDQVVAPEPAPVADERDGEKALVVSEGGGSEEFERLDNLTREYDLFEEDSDYRGTRSRARIAEEGDLKMDAMASAPARPVSLREHLLEQWKLIEIDESTRKLGEGIIDAVDDTGRLNLPLEQIAIQIDPPAPLEKVKDALAQVQQLDPPGIAARDLKECLLLQLEAMPVDTDFEQLLIEQHFEDLQRNRLPQIAKAMGVEIDDIKDALQVISRLSMHPGLDVSDQSAPAVVPDVLVEYNELERRYDVRLARGNTRELRISDEFREAMEKARQDKQAREFIKQKLDAAGAIIDAIRYRRERLLEVGKAVVEAQQEFFDKGEQHMKVLRMSDMAARFGCDPSTISRTVDDKWMQTPRGIFPLRRFFTGGTESADGEALGWDSIKAKVQEIVNGEDKSDPLSDDAIVEKLAADGVYIKRRTVAKYRAQLDIPTARQRRQY